MNIAQQLHQPTQTTNEENLARLLRQRLQEHLEDFGNPILAALQGSGLSVLEVAITWIDLEQRAQRAHDQAFLETGSIQEAIAAMQEARHEIAARLIAAKEGRAL